MQKTAMTTTTTMVTTPTETMMTSSMLLSRGEVGLPWGLLLPVEGKPVHLLVFENSKNAYTQSMETSCKSLCNTLVALDTSVSCNLQSQVYALCTVLNTVPCTKLVFSKSFLNYTKHYTWTNKGPAPPCLMLYYA